MLTILKTLTSLCILFFFPKIKLLMPASDSARLNASKTKRRFRLHYKKYDKGPTYSACAWKAQHQSTKRLPIVREPNWKRGLKFRVGGTQEGESNGPFQHLVHPSSNKKTPVCRTEKVTVYNLKFRGHLKVKLLRIYFFCSKCT